MIIGKLKDLPRYKGLNQNLDTAIDFISNHDLSTLPLGKTEIDGNDVFINRFDYYGEELSNCLLEGHQNYLDIHLVLSGCEYLGYADVSDLNIKTTYDEKTDFIGFEGTPLINCPCYPETFVIVFPEDIHMPKLKINHELVQKAVCKVKLS